MSDIGRLVEVKGTSEGSGFLIAHGLILTAWHLLRPRPGEQAPSTVRVRLERDIKPGVPIEQADQFADRLWPRGDDPGEDFDFALLSIRAPQATRIGNRSGSSDGPISWASLRKWGNVEITAVGYPDVAIDRTLGRRDTKGITGWIQSADNARSLTEGRGTLTMRIRDEDMPAEPPAIVWPALSGAAVFAGGVLIGIVRIAGEESGRHQLRVLPIDRLFTREDTANVMAKSGYPMLPRVDLEQMSIQRHRSRPINFNVPNLPQHYQPRLFDLDNLKIKLNRDEKSVGIIGLCGMGGIGKTVVATALVQDESVRVLFPDGVVWLTFGRDGRALTKAAELVSVITGEATRFETVDAARGHLQEAIRDLALLVVLDDVWQPSATDPFVSLGSKCCVLVTTRDSRVLKRVDASRYDVGLLSHFDSRAFLANVTSTQNANALPQEADGIIRQCGCLPLALTAAGALIRSSTYSWTDALHALEEGAIEELATDLLLGVAERSVAAVLRISVEQLPPQAKECFLACAAFAEDVDIPAATLLRLWASTLPNARIAKQMLRELADRSLIIENEQRRYRIHDLYVDLLHSIAAPLASRHTDLVTRYRETCPSGWDKCTDDGYIIRHLPWHLSQARHLEELRTLLFQPSWLSHKLVHCDIDAVIADMTLIPGDSEAVILAAALRLSANVLSRDYNQLIPHLQSRLVSSHGPTIARLMAACATVDCIAPIRGLYLTPPGSQLRCLEGNDGAFDSIALLPDGRHALAQSNKMSQLWDLESGSLLRHFESAGQVTSDQVLPDGRRQLWATTFDEVLRLRDIETGVTLQRFEWHKMRVVAVLPDGRRALSLSYDSKTKIQTLHLWDIQTGIQLCRFYPHSYTHRVAVLPDGRHALSGCHDGTLRLVSLETGAELRRFERHDHPVFLVVVLPDGRRALSASEYGAMRLWDIETGHELQKYNWGADSVAVLPDGRRMLSASYDGRLRLWDMETGVELQYFEGHTGRVNSVVLLPDGRRALSASDDGTLRLWDIEASPGLRRFKGHTSLIESIAVLPDGRRALSAGGRDRTLRLWDIETGTELRHYDRDTPYIPQCRNSVAILPDGRRALWAYGNKRMRLLDIETGAELQRFEGHTREIYSVAALADGRRALSASGDRTLRLWDVETGAELRRFNGHIGRICSVAALPDGIHALSASEDNKLRLWDVDTGAMLLCFEGHKDSITSIAVLPDGKRVLSASKDKTLRLWDIKTGAELRCFEENNDGITSVVVLPDGGRALSASDTKTLRLLDIETGAELGRYIGEVSITALAVLPSSERVVTGNKIGQVVAFRIPKSVPAHKS